MGPISDTEALDVSPKYGKEDEEPTTHDVLLAKSMDQYDDYLEKPPVDADTIGIPSSASEGEEPLSKESNQIQEQVNNNQKPSEESPEVDDEMETEQPLKTPDSRCNEPVDVMDLKGPQEPQPGTYLPEEYLDKTGATQAPTQNQQINTDRGLAYYLKPCSTDDLKQKAPIVKTKKNPFKYQPAITGLEVVRENQPFRVRDPRTGKLMQAVPVTNSNQLKTNPSVYREKPHKPVPIYYPKDLKPEPSKTDGKETTEPVRQIVTNSGKAFVLTQIPMKDSTSKDIYPIIALQTQPLDTMPGICGISDSEPNEPLQVQDPISGEPLLAVPIADKKTLDSKPCIFVEDPNKPALIHYPDTADENKETPTMQQIVTDKGSAYILKPVLDDEVPSHLVAGEITPLTDKPTVVGIKNGPSKTSFFVKDPVSCDVMQAVPATNSEQLQKMPSLYGVEPNTFLLVYHPESEEKEHRKEEKSLEDIDVSGHQLSTDKGMAYSFEPIPRERNADSIPLLAVQTQPLDEIPKPIKLVPLSDDKPYRVVDPRSGKLALAVPTSDMESLQKGGVFIDDVNKPASIYTGQRDNLADSGDAAAAKAPTKPTHQQVNTDKGLAYSLNPLTHKDRMQRAPVVSTKKKPLKYLPKLIGVETVPDKPPFKVKDHRSGDFMHAVPVTNSEQLKEKPSVFVTKPKKPAMIYYPDTPRTEMPEEPSRVEDLSKSTTEEDIPDESMEITPATTGNLSVPQIVTDEGLAYVLKSPDESYIPSSDQTRPIVAEDTALERVPGVIGVQQTQLQPQPLEVLEPSTGEIKHAFPAQSVDQIQNEPCVFVKDRNQAPKIHYPRKADTADKGEEPYATKPKYNLDDDAPPQQILTDKSWAFRLQQSGAGGGRADPGDHGGNTLPTHIVAIESDPDCQPIVVSPQTAPNFGPVNITDPITGDIMECIPITNAEDLNTEPLAFMSGENQPIKIYDPKTRKTKVAYPIVDNDEKPEFKSEDQDRKDKVNDIGEKQLATDKGLAFTLSPLTEHSQPGTPFMTVDTSPLEELPSVEGLITNPEAKPFRISDPVSGDLYAAYPAVTVEDLENAPSVYVSDTNKPALIHYPIQSLESCSKPTTKLDSALEEPVSEDPASQVLKQLNDKSETPIEEPATLKPIIPVEELVSPIVDPTSIAEKQPFTKESAAKGDQTLHLWQSESTDEPTVVSDVMKSKPYSQEQTVEKSADIDNELESTYPKLEPILTQSDVEEIELDVEELPVPSKETLSYDSRGGDTSHPVLTHKPLEELGIDSSPNTITPLASEDKEDPCMEDILPPDSNTEALDVSPKFGEDDGESYDILLPKSMDACDVYLDKEPIVPDTHVGPDQQTPTRIGHADGDQLTESQSDYDDLLAEDDVMNDSEEPPSLVRTSPVPSSSELESEFANEDTMDVTEPSFEHLVSSTPFEPGVQVNNTKKPYDEVVSPVSMLSEEVKPSPKSSDDTQPMQLVTDQGPVYVLVPLDETTMTPDDETAGSQGDGSAPGYVISPGEVVDEKPKLTGARKCPDDTKPIRITDRQTGVDMVAVPCTYPNDITNKPIAIIADDKSKPATLFYPDKCVKAYPKDTKQYLDKISTKPNNGDNDAVDVDDVGDLDKEEDSVPANQIVTANGPAYVLSPVTEPELNSIVGDTAKTGGMGPEYTILSETIPDSIPPITSIAPTSDTTLFVVNDPSSNQKMIARPASSECNLNDGVVAIIGDTPDKPMKIYNNNTGTVSVAIPTTTEDDDICDSSEYPESVGSTEHELPKAGHQIQPEEDSFGDFDVEKPAKDQVMTEVGPAYTLRPITESELADVAAANDGLGGTYAISEEVQSEELPSVLGIQEVFGPKPFIVQDPNTGQVLLADIAVSHVDIVDGLVGVIEESPERPLKIHDTNTGKVFVALPSESTNVSQTSASMEPETTERDGYPPAEPVVSVGDNQPEKQNVVSEDVVASAVQPLESQWKNRLDELETKQPTKEKDLPTSLQKQHDAKEDTEVSTPTSAATPSKDTYQVVTEKGPAFVLTPVSQDVVDDINSSWPQETSEPRFTVLCNLPSESLPPVTDIRQVPECRPFIVQDPSTGQLLAAEPAQSALDLSRGIVGVLDDTTPNNEMKILDNTTGQVSVAVLTETLEESESESDDLLVSDEEDSFPRSPRSLGQIITDDGPAYVMRPISLAAIDELTKSQDSDEDSSSSDQFGPEYTVMRQIPSDSVPHAVGVQPDQEKPFIVHDADKDEMMIAEPAVKPSDLRKPVVGIMNTSDSKSVRIHDNQSGKVSVAYPSDNIPPESEMDFPEIVTENYTKTEITPVESPWYHKLQDLQSETEDEPSIDLLDGELPEVQIPKQDTPVEDQPSKEAAEELDVKSDEFAKDNNTDMPLTKQQDALQPVSNTEALDVTPKYGDNNEQPVVYDVLLAKSMDQYDVYLEKPPIDPDVQPVPVSSEAETQQPDSRTTALDISPRYGEADEEDITDVVLLAKSMDEYDQYLEKQPIDPEPYDSLPDEHQLSKGQIVTENGPAYTLTPIADEDIAEIEPSDGEETPSVLPSDYSVQKAIPSDVVPPAVGIKPVNHKPFIVKDPESGQSLLAEPAKRPSDLKKGIVGVLEETPQKTFKIHDVNNDKTTDDVPSEENEDQSVSKESEPEDESVQMPSSEDSVCQDQPVDKEEPGSEKSEEEKPEIHKPKEVKSPAKQQILTKKGPAYILRPLTDEDVDEEGVPLTSSLDVSGGGGSGRFAPDYTIQKSEPSEKVPPVIGIRRLYDTEPIYVQDPSSGQTMVAEPAQNAGDLKTGMIGIVEDKPNRPMRIHDNDTGNVSVALPSDDLPYDPTDQSNTDESTPDESYPKKPWTPPYSSIRPSETMDSGFGSRKTSVSSKPRSELGSSSSVRDLPGFVISLEESGPDEHEDPTQEIFEDASDSRPSTPGYYTPDSGSPALSREGTFVKEQPEETPSPSAGLSALGLIARALGFSPREQKEDKPVTDESESGEDAPDIPELEEPFKPTFAKPVLVKRELTPEKLKKDAPPVVKQESPVPLYKPLFVKETPVARTPAEEVQGSPATKPKADSPHKPGWPMTPPPEPLRTKVIFPDSAAKTLGQSRKAPSGLPTLPEGVEKIDELNKSFDELRLKMEEKQRRLKEALGNQQDYQNALAQVSIRIDNAQTQLEDPAMEQSLQEQIDSIKDLLDEIDEIQDNIDLLQEKGESLVTPGDTTSQDAMHATVKELMDKANKLEEDAKAKLKQLQTDKEEEEALLDKLAACQKEVDALSDWLEDFKDAVQPEDGVQSGDEEEPDINAIQEQLVDNQNKQLELSRKAQKLQEVADIIEQANDTAKQPTRQGEHLDAQADTLKTQMGELQKDLKDKQEHLNTRRNTEQMALDYQSDVQKLQDWLDTHRSVAGALKEPMPSEVGSESLQKQVQLQQKLEEELSRHQALLKSVARRGTARKRQSSSSLVDDGEKDPDGELQDLKVKWMEISKQEAERKQQLQASLEFARSQNGSLQQHPPVRRALSFDFPSRTDENPDEELKASLQELNKCWEKLQTQVVDKQTRLEQVFEFQSSYQTTLQAVSAWLDSVQLKLFSADWRKDTQTQLAEHAELQDEIHGFQGQLDLMNEVCQQVMSDTNAQNQRLIRQALADLNDRLATLENEAQQKEQELVERSRQHKLFQDEVLDFQNWLSDTKRQLMSREEAEEDCLEEKINENQQLENEIQQYEGKLRELMSKGELLLTLDPQTPAISTELSLLQTNWEDLLKQASIRRQQLNKAKIIQEQYHKIIKDYMDFLDTAEQKLKVEELTASDAADLAQQLDKHKEFFQDLDMHHMMIESIAHKADPYTQHLFASQRTLLDKQSGALQVKATSRGQQMEKLLSEWNQFEKNLQDLRSWVGHVEMQMPGQVSDENQENVQKGINKYQAMKSLLQDRRPNLQQILTRGQSILKIINALPLEQKLTTLADNWQDIENKIKTDLDRLTGLMDNWKAFDKECMEFLPWLTDTMKQLEDWSHPNEAEGDKAEPDPITIRMDKFMEFRKNVENYAPLQESVINHGHQLIKVKQLNMTPIRERLTLIENKWADLQHELPMIQEDLHQHQMQMLPSRQALNELMIWMDTIEKDMENHQVEMYSSAQEVDNMMQIYQGYKIDLSSKLLTVEFVNQSVLQMSMESIDGKRGDKTDFAEKLGQMNKRWQAINTRVYEEVKNLDNLWKDWRDYEKAVSDVLQWFHDQEARCRKFEGKVGHETNVQLAVKACQSIEEAVESKQPEISKLQQRGLRLASRELVEASMGQIRGEKDNLKSLIDQVKAVLITALEQWKLYHECLQRVNQCLGKAEYSSSRVNMVSGTADSLQMQVAKLKGPIATLKDLQSEFKGNRVQLTNLCKLADQLGVACKPAVRENLERTTNGLCTRWSSADDQMRETLNVFEQSLLLWQNFEEKHSFIEEWLQEKEKKCENVLGCGDDGSISETDSETGRDNDRETQVQACKELLMEVSNFHEIPLLNSLVEQLTRHMDGPTANNVISRKKVLAQRLEALRQILSRHIQHTEDDIKSQRKFADKAEDLISWLEEAQDKIDREDPNRSSDENSIRDRMSQLKEVMREFSSHQPEVYTLNEMGYRLSLDKTNASNLATLNTKWNELSSKTSEKFRKLQSVLLQQQSFSQKCDAWMNFLAETERNLAVDIAGSYKELLEQQKVYEAFEADIFNRQQILFSIISDGQRMVQEGELDDPDEFQHKLSQLSEQWQNVIRRAAQRKEIIDKNIMDWQAYHSLLGKLHQWYHEIQDEIKAYEVSTAALQKIRSLAEQAKDTQKAVEVQEGQYLAVNEAGKLLLRISDRQAAEILKAELTDVQTTWHHITTRLRKNSHHLEDVLSEWDGSDKTMEELQQWLRDVKRRLATALPGMYEELQRDMEWCKEIENTFDSSVSKLDKLHQAEQCLTNAISPDDMAVLHERIVLLAKQWDEIHLQTCLRRKRIADKLNEWSYFGQKYKEMSDWLTEMEVKVAQNGESSIEDLLHKLRMGYQEEIEEGEQNKEQLITLGTQLMHASNENRANDIEYKLAKLTDRWKRLMELMDARVRKLQETLTAVQQLEQNMVQLKQWLTHMEHELGTPVVYETCQSAEIQEKLHNQQELQKDIEKHSTGVASVLNLCEVLLHDCDACSTDADCESIQNVTRTLDQRWRNICTQSMERKMRIEETWRLWQKFQEDYQRFEEWLDTSEKAASYPHTQSAPFAVVREEIRKFEMFQRKVHENLTQLEIINKQYRRLAREGRTDNSKQLRTMVQDANNRWDSLARRCANILRRLRHMQVNKEEFDSTRESMLVWLTEMDLQLTNVEHFSESDTSMKIKQMTAFQHEIGLNQSRLEIIDEEACLLMQKCDPSDAANIQEDMDELHRYAQEVFARVGKFQRKLQRISSAQAEASELSDGDDETDEEYLESIGSGVPSPDRSRSPSSPYIRPISRSPLESSPRPDGRQSPTSSHISRDSKSARRIPRSRDSSATRSLSPSRGETVSGRITPASVSSLDWDMFVTGNSSPLESSGDSWRYRRPEVDAQQVREAIEECTTRLEATENALRCRTPTGPEIEEEKIEYENLVSDCKCSVDTLRRLIPKMPEDTELLHQVSGVMSRWEIIQGEVLEKDSHLSQNYQQWQQFKNDLQNLNTWLDEAEAILYAQVGSNSIEGLADTNKKYKEFLLGLNARKAIALSINLCSQQFTHPESPQGPELKEKLKVMNHRWEAVCARAGEWQRELKVALIQCDEFHQTTKEMLEWLNSEENILDKNEPVDLSAEPEKLIEQYRVFTGLKRKLEASQPKVMSLKDTADQYLADVDLEACRTTKTTREKINLIAEKNEALLKRCNVNLERLETTIDPSEFDISSSRGDESIPRGVAYPLGTVGEMIGDLGSSPTPVRTSTPIYSIRNYADAASNTMPLADRVAVAVDTAEAPLVRRRRPLLARAMRAALPLHLLMLLLLGVACLVPITEDDYSCSLTNNFARSLQPMLRYPNGSPPI